MVATPIAVQKPMERRRHQRVRISLIGRYMLNGGMPTFPPSATQAQTRSASAALRTWQLTENPCGFS